MNRAITWGMHCFWAHLYVHISKEVSLLSLLIDCYFWMNFLLNITGISVGSPVNEDFPKPTDILWRLENQPLWSSRYVFFYWISVIQQKIMLIMGTYILHGEMWTSKLSGEVIEQWDNFFASRISTGRNFLQRFPRFWHNFLLHHSSLMEHILSGVEDDF